MFRKDLNDGAYGLSSKYRYVSDWVEPTWWNEDVNHDEARRIERERKERAMSNQYVESRVLDPEIEQNVAYAAQVPEDRSQTFLRLVGDIEERVLAGTVGTTDRFFQRVPVDDYWPSEHREGSTFRYADWERYRDFLNLSLIHI